LTVLNSGKSTLILLLLRLLDPSAVTEHSLTIDSIPLTQIDPAAVRRHIIAVPQDVVFLPDGTSIQQNLDPCGDAGVDECLAVLKEVGLNAVVNSLGGLGAGMIISNFSQGQKQLFSLARAVLRKRIRAREDLGPIGGVLILDEYSSSVDYNTDRAMRDVIKREFNEYTIIMVSHRLVMVLEFYTVVVMGMGRILEIGDPRVLKSLAGSRFLELITASGLA
jgi:ATP-binding cassette subfamily C (CFTR/MRP) protein 1